jgi:hypothetical protein
MKMKKMCEATLIPLPQCPRHDSQEARPTPDLCPFFHFHTSLLREFVRFDDAVTLGHIKAGLLVEQVPHRSVHQRVVYVCVIAALGVSDSGTERTPHRSARSTRHVPLLTFPCPPNFFFFFFFFTACSENLGLRHFRKKKIHVTPANSLDSCSNALT